VCFNEIIAILSEGYIGKSCTLDLA